MEDFVSFEIAKKLKEKGFDEECLAYYTSEHTLYTNRVVLCDDKYLEVAEIDYEECLYSYNTQKDRFIRALIDSPTISQVLKWLRDEKKIYVMIDRSFSVKNSWHYVICNNDDFEHLIQQESIPNRTWEQAALAGIEDVLDNLI